MNIANAVTKHSQAKPNHPALLFEKQIISYATLEQRVTIAAIALRERGVEPGDRVAILLPNTPGFIETYLGVQKLGAVAVSINTWLKTDELTFVINDCEARVIVTTNKLQFALNASRLPLIRHTLIFPECFDQGSNENATMRVCKRNAQDPAAIVYTSGTTGIPKGAVLSQENVISTASAKTELLGIRPDDRLLLFLPLYHCFGQNAILNSAFHAGAAVALYQTLDSKRMLDSIHRDRVSMLFGTPSFYRLMLGQASCQDLKSVRFCFSAATNLPLDLERDWLKKFGMPLNQGYGLTETSPFASYNHAERYVPGSLGTPIPGVSMRIAHPETGGLVPVGERGEILIKGPNVMLGYWKRPKETAEAIRDGWLHSGDLGRVDEAGYFFHEGRLKEMISVGGLKVYPAEVERVLLTHPAVAEVAVIGVEDRFLGEQVQAHVVIHEGRSMASHKLTRFCKDRIAAYKTPTSIIQRKQLPKSPAGKILRRMLGTEKLEAVT